LRLTKGVHLVLDRPRLPVPDAVAMTDEGRILFAIPWGERVILGTTDTDYDGPIEAVRTEPADVEYILDIANRCFPGAGLTPADMLSSWAGLRPLLADKRGGPSDISRAHQIGMPEPGWLDVAGGKLTTYRLIAEEAVDRIAAFLGAKGPRCTTAQEPLVAASDAAWSSAIVPPEPSANLVEHYCTREWAVHLADVMIRRTSWHYYVKNRLELADRVAGWMAGSLGWDAARLAAEQAQYRQTPS
jgi:glycerol-3-phosphate dehydrogenase